MVTNILTFLEETAARYPERTAWADPECAMTYRDYRDGARKLGTAIARKVGCTRRPIAVAIDRDAKTPTYFMAVVYAGNFYVPVDFAQPEARVRSMLETTEPVLILAPQAVAEQHEALLAPFEVMDPLEEADTPADDALLEAIRQQSCDTDPLYAIFTSGSTGTPKGIVVAHRSVIDLVAQFSRTFAFDETSRFGNQAPFDFDVSVKDIYHAMACGGTVQVIPQALFSTPMNLIDYLNEHRLNTLIWATSALRIIENFDVLSYATPKFVKWLMFSGEIMPNKVLNYWRRHLPDITYVNLYGPTEITCNCSYYKVDRDFADDEPLPIGVPFANTRIILLDEEDHLIEGPGKVGELCVLGSSLSLGYYNNPEQTAVAFTRNPLQRAYPEPMYRTGDLAAYNERGELMFISRKDDQIKHMGHRIELGEIEAAVNALPYIRAAFCHYDADEERIHLYYVADEAMTRTIRRDLRTKLPKYMLPNRFHHCATFPLNKNHKIDRKRIIREYR